MLVNTTATLPANLPSAITGHVSSSGVTMATGQMVMAASPPIPDKYIAMATQKDTTYTKIFVGGLPYHTTDKSLREHFEVYGEIEEAVVITDRQTGKSRGYGFVTMADRSGADRAIKDPNPVIDGRKANVNLAYLGAKPRGPPAAASAAAAAAAALSFSPQAAAAAGLRFMPHPSALTGTTAAYSYPTGGMPGAVPSSFFYTYPFGTPGAASLPGLSYLSAMNSVAASQGFPGAAEYSPAIHFSQAGATAFAPSAQPEMFTGAHALSTAGAASYGVNLAQIPGAIPAAALGYAPQAQPALTDTRSVIQ